MNADLRVGEVIRCDYCQLLHYIVTTDPGGGLRIVQDFFVPLDPCNIIDQHPQTVLQ